MRLNFTPIASFTCCSLPPNYLLRLSSNFWVEKLKQKDDNEKFYNVYFDFLFGTIIFIYAFSSKWILLHFNN